MSRIRSFRSRVAVRRSVFRPAVEQLESRLAPGDMLGLSGSALWGLSLAGSGATAGLAGLALTAARPAQRWTEEDTPTHGPRGFVLEVSAGSGARAADTEVKAARTADPAPARGPLDPVATTDLDGLGAPAPAGAAKSRGFPHGTQGGAGRSTGAALLDGSGGTSPVRGTVGGLTS